ncbi:MAG: FecR domain-containing protein [Elusimicrobiota bacterium]
MKRPLKKSCKMSLRGEAEAIPLSRTLIRCGVIIVAVGIFISAISPLLLDARSKSGTNKVAAVVTFVSGRLDVQRSGRTAWKSCKPGSFIYEGDKLRTARRSRAALVFSNGGEMKISENTIFDVDVAEATEKELRGGIRLRRGRTYNKSVGLRAKIVVRTPVAVVSVRGTEYDTSVDENGDTSVIVVDGSVIVENEFGKVVVNANQKTDVSGGKAPEPAQDMSAADMDESTKWQKDIKIEKKNLRLKIKTDTGEERTLKLRFSK